MLWKLRRSNEKRYTQREIPSEKTPEDCILDSGSLGKHTEHPGQE